MSEKSSSKSPKKRKIFRDPIHGNIEIFPFELKIIDLKIFQRLRYIKQTPSVSYVFHSANHTRFEHSLGCLHIAEMYARNLDIKNRERELLRLCALLHDIGHCIFSHQYDVTIYKEIYPNKKHGHDEHRKKIIRDYLPDKLIDTYGKNALRKTIEDSGLKEYLNEEEPIKSIMDDVSRILEEGGTWKYNVIQGPFGCDRLDFIKRDSYFSGTGHYGGYPLDRLILFSSIEKDEDDNETLCYSSKILDDIILMLINRFHMFKNVYFHKTCRALDLMFQQLLEYSKEPLNLVERTKNIEEFEKLNELNFFSEISYCYQNQFDNLKKKVPQKEISDFLERSKGIEGFYGEFEEPIINKLKMLRKLFKACELVSKILVRDSYKCLTEDEESFDKLEREKIKKIFNIALGKGMKERAEGIIEQIKELSKKNEEKCPELFSDVPYELTMDPTKELSGSNIDVFDEKEKKVKKYNEMKRVKKYYKSWKIESLNIYRIYTTSNAERKRLSSYVKKIKTKENKETEGVDTAI